MHTRNLNNAKVQMCNVMCVSPDPLATTSVEERAKASLTRYAEHHIPKKIGMEVFASHTDTRGILHALCPTTSSSSSQETTNCNHFGFTSQFDPYFRRRRFLFSGLGPWGNAAAITFSPSESARLERLPIREGWAVSSHIDPIFFYSSRWCCCWC